MPVELLDPAKRTLDVCNLAARGAIRVAVVSFDELPVGKDQLVDARVRLGATGLRSACTSTASRQPFGDEAVILSLAFRCSNNSEIGAAPDEDYDGLARSLL